MKHDVGLAALIVNFNTGTYAVCCVESLLHEWQQAGRDRERLQIVCVDNASPEDQEPFLARLEELGVEVVRSPDNLGYAAGMNLAYEHTRGEPGDVVAILNPDLHFLPGTVESLIDYVLDHPEVGCVDPATSIDPLGVFSLPRNLLPTVLEHWRVMLAQLLPFFGRLYSRYRVERNIEWWTTDQPLETDMLSGCCLFMRRAVVDEMGRPMDPRYPLYFEDTDLFRTLQGLGYKVVHHRGIRILHHWSRSAQVSGLVDDEPTRRFEVSRKAYYRKFYGPLGRWLYGLMNSIAARWPVAWRARPILPLVDLGPLSEPVTVQLPRHCKYLVEISVSPTFVICAGVFGEGDSWTCPPETWEWLFQIDFFLRAVDMDTRHVLGAWRFSKSVPGRTLGMHPDELDRYSDRLLAHNREAS